MKAVKHLLKQVEDPALRRRLDEEFDRISETKTFGLVFEEHLPEVTPLPGVEPSVGAHVARKAGPLNDVWRVVKIERAKARCVNRASGEEAEHDVDGLVVVKQFGDPIFPALVHVDAVQAADPAAPWHTLIEADNHHALQLLEYLYPEKVDAIYIDPPYNTGARDWKYNNDYVDRNDRWRHSKWLSMMSRRLQIAENLLKPGGLICLTIDDYEHHHLRTLLDTRFGNLVFQGCLVIRTTPSGRPSEKGIRVNHEYALIYGKGESAKVGRLPISEGQEEFFDEYDEDGPFGWQNLRKRGGANTLRRARPKQHYPLFVTQKEARIPKMSYDKATKAWVLEEKPRKGEQVLYPIGDDDRERIWSLGVETLAKEIDKLEIRKEADGRFSLWRKIRPNPEGSLPRTWWESDDYSIARHGAAELESILGRDDKPFPFPKSPYAVRDCLRVIGGGKKDALILDFFAGSGTTLHAVNLMNAADGGRRRVILVTNNEVGQEEAARLAARGLKPGDPEWEAHGVCRSITWPRSKFIIRGHRDDGTPLPGVQLTGRKTILERARRFKHLTFVRPEDLRTQAKRKELVSLIQGVPASSVTEGLDHALSDKETDFASVLFDPRGADAWLDALEGKDHVTDLYVVGGTKREFADVKERIDELLGPRVVVEEEKKPMSDGLPANLQYFKLEFLDKAQVALRKRFREILPLLWLKAGAVGPCPALKGPEPGAFIPPTSNFAVLLREAGFADFKATLEKMPTVQHVFLVTSSEESFLEMTGELTQPTTQLYRDYLDNFLGNRRRA